MAALMPLGEMAGWLSDCLVILTLGDLIFSFSFSFSLFLADQKNAGICSWCIIVSKKSVPTLSRILIANLVPSCDHIPVKYVLPLLNKLNFPIIYRYLDKNKIEHLPGDIFSNQSNLGYL